MGDSRVRVASSWLLMLMAVAGSTVGTPETCKPKTFCNIVDYFHGVGAGVTPLNITWAHAVNSQKLLQEAIAGSVDMLEADISLGVKEGSPSNPKPIMAHPPANTSDLTFDEFISQVIIATKNGAKKGIKLDFKSIEVVEPALRILKRHGENITFPVMLNADVLPGPVNATTIPVNGPKFLNLTQTFFPKAYLSLGWTTKFDCSNPGRYEKSHFDAMKDLINTEIPDVSKDRITFPVRAGLIAETNEEHIHEFQSDIRHSTFTLWSSVGDPVNPLKLKSFVDHAGSGNIYADLPFSLDDPEDGCSTNNETTGSSMGSIMERPSTAVLMLLMYAGFRRHV